MFLIVGLGNPGPQYLETRHNIGFMLVDEITQEAGSFCAQKRFDSLTTRVFWNGFDLVFLKPQSYMNLSGSAVQQALSFFKISEKNLVVLFDDLDQAPGAVKTRLGGGHGGHNGLRDILEKVRRDQFYRVKIGIGKPEHKTATAQWVLGKFNEQELHFLKHESFPIAKARLLAILKQLSKNGTC